jgi:hypothetical protein
MQHSIDRTGSEGRRDSGPPTRDTDAWRVLTVQHLVAEDVLDTIVHEGDISRAVGILHLCDVAETAESREQRAESREQRAESRAQRAESREQRAESREQRAESREQRAESREQRAESREQRAESSRNKRHILFLFVVELFRRVCLA